MAGMMNEVPLKAGDLSKRGGSSKDKKSLLSMNSLKKRYVALYSNELRISDGAGINASVKHIIKCHSYKIRIDINTPEMFQIETDIENQQFEFTLDSSEEVDEWVSILIDTTLKARNEENDLYKRHAYLLGTPFSDVYYGNYDALSTSLKEQGSSIISKLDLHEISLVLLSLYRKQEDILSLLVLNGASLKYTDIDTLNSLLHVACEYGTINQIKLILNHEFLDGTKCDESFLNLFNQTPLDITILKRSAKPNNNENENEDNEEDSATIIKMLCNAGADASQSLKYLCNGPYKMPYKVLKALLINGAKPNLPHKFIKNNENSEKDNETNASDDNVSSSPSSSSSSKSLHEMRAIDRILLDAGPGDLDLNGTHLNYLILLLLYGAHVNKTFLSHLQSLLSPYAMDEVNKAIEESLEETKNNGLNSAKVGTVVVNKKGWVPDKESTICLSCHSKFTTTHRRHHCRFCAELVCADCSSRKLVMKNEPGKKVGHRACDRCFNREQSTVEDENLFKKSPPLYMSSTSSLSDMDETVPTGNINDIDNNNTNNTKNTLSKAKAQLKANQETLNRTNDASAQLKENASEYRNLTKQLVEEQKKKNSKASLW